MKTSKSSPKTIDQYIAGFPAEVQNILEKIRTTIRKAAPKADESISYGIATFKLDGRPLIYFAAYKSHIGLYPMTAGIKTKFKKELSSYEGGKGTLKFPLDEPIPFALIGRLVKFKVNENRAHPKAKGR